MNDSISSWVDEDEMRRLAESLLSRPYGHELNLLEVDFGSQFEGFADSLVAEPVVVVEPVFEPVIEPVREQVAEPVREPVVEPVPEPVSAPIVEPVREPVIAVEPRPEPIAQPELIAHPEVHPEPKIHPEFQPQVSVERVVPPPPPIEPHIPSPPPVAVEKAEPEPQQIREEEPKASGPPPSVMRAAVKFLKKAQAEGRAGGVIRSAGDSPSTPAPSLLPPSDATAVNIPAPATPEPRPIHSPFRRVSDVEKEAVEEVEPEPSVLQPPSIGKLASPPKPNGEDPILARVMTFGKWLKGPVGVRNFFVANTEGKILIDELGNTKLIQVARSLAGASNGAGEGEVGSLHVRIGEDSILEVVPTQSQFGLLILGLIVEHPLPEEVIRKVRLGLEEVANARLIKGQSRK